MFLTVIKMNCIGVQIENYTLRFNDRAQSKCGTLDYINHIPGGGEKKVRTSLIIPGDYKLLMCLCKMSLLWSIHFSSVLPAVTFPAAEHVTALWPVPNYRQRGTCEWTTWVFMKMEHPGVETVTSCLDDEFNGATTTPHHHAKQSYK